MPTLDDGDFRLRLWYWVYVRVNPRAGIIDARALLCALLRFSFYVGDLCVYLFASDHVLLLCGDASPCVVHLVCVCVVRCVMCS